MKIVCAAISAALALGTLNACAAAPPKSNVVAESAAVDCASASGALSALEHGSLAKLNAVVQHLACFDGARAEAAEDILGGLVATHPKSVLSAFHADETPAVVIQDVAANPSSKYVDNSCGLIQELDRRLVALQSVREFSRERDMAVQSIKQFKLQVEKHCVAAE